MPLQPASKLSNYREAPQATLPVMEDLDFEAVNWAAPTEFVVVFSLGGPAFHSRSTTIL
jgi:hypothetical protein